MECNVDFFSFGSHTYKKLGNESRVGCVCLNMRYNVGEKETEKVSGMWELGMLFTIEYLSVMMRFNWKSFEWVCVCERLRNEKQNTRKTHESETKSLRKPTPKFWGRVFEL